ncbi:SWI/SNF complex subunit SWI3A homolog [Typha angustifolia]|uniref:SWI/SNF complex subunit SWI3A homolog n=1 Tax=Typha angustifolia TaxID=59011 RepID=UPI003C30DA94
MNPHSDEDDLARDLYTIPISSSWFQWDEIHETEKKSVPEFFEGCSITRSPRVYKEYRDFVINKYREDPSRRLTFTEIRKGLIGDVCLLRKLFQFLEKWGLINFGVADGAETTTATAEVAGPKVVVEEGAPAGVQVVMPAISAERKSVVAKGAVGGENGFRLPPLTSYSDVFGEWLSRKTQLCGFCGEQCGASHVETLEDGLVVCSKCSKNKNDEEEGTVEDLRDNKDSSNSNAAGAWTDAETLLLLEAVLKHGDDWDLIAQHVRTKSKSDCIARLIQLPFGEHMLGTINGKYDSRISVTKTDDVRKNQHSLIKLSKEATTDCTQTDDKENVKEEVTQERPLKRRCLPSSIDATGSLMEEVALLSMVAGPHVAVTAADAAVTALCNENKYARKAFEINEYEIMNKSFSSNAEQQSDYNVGDQDMVHEKAEKKREKNFGATAYRIRAAIGTALGAAAARAKLLADHEEREMELLMASIIEAQLRKIRYKIKHFEELEFIMEEEYTILQQLKESILEEWVTVLQQAFQAGIPRWRDHVLPKLPVNKITL